jgi:hypothetical protein
MGIPAQTSQSERRSMNNRFCLLLSTLLLLAGFQTGVTAGTIEFTGIVTNIEEPSVYFQVGDAVTLSYSFTDPLVDKWTGNFPNNIFLYDADSAELVVGTNTYAPNDGDSALFGSEYNYFGQYGPNFGAAFNNDVVPFTQIGFYSTTHVVTSSDGILLPDFPISDFDFAFGRLVDKDGGTAFWDITSYTSNGFTGSSGGGQVPESMSTILAVGSTFIGMWALRRKAGRI